MSKKTDLILGLGLVVLTANDTRDSELSASLYKSMKTCSTRAQTVSKKDRKKQKSKRRMAKRSRR